MTTTVEILHGHLFCGLGGGAKGFNKAQPRAGGLVGKMRCLGGIDVDPASIRDFGRLAGVAGTVMDLFDRDQYRAFHGVEPPLGWREATPSDIVRAMGGERPHIWFLSAPCKGFSGLLSEGKSKTDKYQALNRLTLRGIWLALEAYKDDPVELIVFENVPRIATRGRHLLDQIVALLRHYGYAVAETTHDCGELGGLAQSRRRFLLVARHQEKVPAFLYQPVAKPLKAVGDVLGRMPLPGDIEAAGPMHRIPSLQWKTWVRLAFVQAGSDWRSLNRLAVEDGSLRDYLIVPEARNGYLGVNAWDNSMGTVPGESLPTNGAHSVADPRFDGLEYSQYGVCRWEGRPGTIIGVKSPGQGVFSVADPRTGVKHNNCFRVVRMLDTAGTVTGGTGPSAGGQAVADPRSTTTFQGKGKYRVTGMGEFAGTVLARSDTGQGAYAVADPRPAMDRVQGDHYLTGGHYGVLPWEGSAGAVSAAACHDNGRWSVADPRVCDPVQVGKLPAPADKLIAVIRAEDGTWHRPFTTFELAGLQSLIDPEEQLELDGLSDQAWRERIGNAVPPEAAEAIGDVMGTTLLLSWSGETFILSAQPVWVRPIALGLTLAQGVIA